MLVCAALPTGSNKYIIIRRLLYYYNFGLQKLPLPIKDNEGLLLSFCILRSCNLQTTCKHKSLDKASNRIKL
jgi:hypothetical protein